MFASGMQLPSSGASFGPLMIVRADHQTVGSEDVAFSPSSYWIRAIKHRAVRIVFDRDDLGRDIVLVSA